MYTKITIYTCKCTQSVVYYTRKLQNNTKQHKKMEEQEMKKELEKLLARVNWQIESKERSLKQEKETLVHEAQNLNTNYVKQTCV